MKTRTLKLFTISLLCFALISGNINVYADDIFSTFHTQKNSLNIAINQQLSDVNTFPVKYDLREQNSTTPAKEQGELGSCWALASIGALESSLKISEGKEYDLSENNMINTLSNIYGDGFDREYYNGGDDAMAASYYASWAGPVLESEDPYSATLKDHALKTGLKPVKHVQDIVFLPKRKNPTDNSLYKEYIMKYGGISSSMWKGTPQTFGEFYNEDKFAWYYPYTYMNKEGNGHAVTIVGWDDNFSKEYFAKEPPGNGAFIVKNTKGPLWGQKDKKENLEGYFYISYYDGMLGDKLDSNVGTSVFTRVDDTDNYDNIYQYDIMGYTKSIKQGRDISFANVFSVNKGTNEKLSAVSFYTLDENLQYEIWINTNYKDRRSFENMIKVGSGNIKLPGYHTLDLNKKYDLKKNSKIAVMVKLTSNDIKPSMAIESPKGLMSSKAEASTGQSYFFDKNNNWVDLTSVEANANVCLKIFTDNGEISSEKLVAVEDMKYDVDFIVKWLSEHQPVAKQYGFNDKQKSIIEQVYSQINEPMIKDKFYLIINRLFTMMGDGHDILHYSPENKKSICLPVVWLESGIFVNQTEGNFIKGDKILSIGGKTAEELNNMLYDQIGSENDYWIHANAPSYLVKELYLKYFNLLNDDKTVDIEVERNNEKIVFKEPISMSVSSPQAKNREWISWHIETENNLGYFQFDKWESGEKLEEIKKNMDNFFAEVSKNNISNIVFDLRENPGGTAQTLTYMLKYLDTGTVYEQGYKEYSSNDSEKVSFDLLYKGNTYVMISNRTFSCSVYATTILKDNGIVKVIGEPSGENPAFNKHGSGADGSLPKMGWNFMMTSSTYDRPLDNDNSEKAIFPDIPVYTTIDDIIACRDIQMIRMREIANKTFHFNEVVETESSDSSFIIVQSNEFGVDGDKNITTDLDINCLGQDNIWIEDKIERKKIQVNIENTSEKIIVKPTEELKNDTTYYLVISYNEKKYTVPVCIKSAPVQQTDFNIISTRYSPKWNYWTITFTKDIKNSFKRSNFIIKDSNGDNVKIKYISIGSTEKNVLLVTPEIKHLLPGTYTLYISEGAVESVEGDKYTEDIVATYTVE